MHKLNNNMSEKNKEREKERERERERDGDGDGDGEREGLFIPSSVSLRNIQHSNTDNI